MVGFFLVLPFLFNFIVTKENSSPISHNTVYFKFPSTKKFTEIIVAHTYVKLNTTNFTFAPYSGAVNISIINVTQFSAFFNTLGANQWTNVSFANTSNSVLWDVDNDNLLASVTNNINITINTTSSVRQLALLTRDFNLSIPENTITWKLNVTSCVGAGCYASGTYQPDNQTSSVGFFMIGNNGTMNHLNVTACLNTAATSCMQWFLSINNTLETSIDYNITDNTCSVSNETVVTNLAIKEEEELWSYLVFTSCTPGTTYTANWIFGDK